MLSGDDFKLKCPRLNLLEAFNVIIIKRKKISYDQELIQSDHTSCPQTKREITKYIN